MKRPWCWERLKAGGKGDDRGWDGWMASLTQRLWVWASSRRWWRIGKSGMLQSMGSQITGHDWATEQQKGWYYCCYLYWAQGDEPWVFFGRNDAKAETPVLWPPYAKSWLIGKNSDAGRDWGQEEKGTTEDEMAGWHHRLDGHKFERTLGVGDGQGGLGCWDSWGRKESDTTERLNWTELNMLDKEVLFKNHIIQLLWQLCEVNNCYY